MCIDESFAVFEPSVPHAIQGIPLERRRDVEPSTLIRIQATLEATLVPSPLAEVAFLIREGRPSASVLARSAAEVSPVILVRMERADPVHGATLMYDLVVKNQGHRRGEPVGRGADGPLCPS